MSQTAENRRVGVRSGSRPLQRQRLGARRVRWKETERSQRGGSFWRYQTTHKPRNVLVYDESVFFPVKISVTYCICGLRQRVVVPKSLLHGSIGLKCSGNSRSASCFFFYYYYNHDDDDDELWDFHDDDETKLLVVSFNWSSSTHTPWTSTGRTKPSLGRRTSVKSWLWC